MSPSWLIQRNEVPICSSRPKPSLCCLWATCTFSCRPHLILAKKVKGFSGQGKTQKADMHTHTKTLLVMLGDANFTILGECCERDPPLDPCISPLFLYSIVLCVGWSPGEWFYIAGRLNRWVTNGRYLSTSRREGAVLI